MASELFLVDAERLSSAVRRHAVVGRDAAGRLADSARALAGVLRGLGLRRHADCAKRLAAITEQLRGMPEEKWRVLADLAEQFGANVEATALELRGERPASTEHELDAWLLAANLIVASAPSPENTKSPSEPIAAEPPVVVTPVGDQAGRMEKRTDPPDERAESQRRRAYQLHRSLVLGAANRSSRESRKNVERVIDELLMGAQGAPLPSQLNLSWRAGEGRLSTPARHVLESVALIAGVRGFIAESVGGSVHVDVFSEVPVALEKSLDEKLAALGGRAIMTGDSCRFVIPRHPERQRLIPLRVEDEGWVAVPCEQLLEVVHTKTGVTVHLVQGVRRVSVEVTAVAETDAAWRFPAPVGAGRWYGVALDTVGRVMPLPAFCDEEHP